MYAGSIPTSASIFSNNRPGGEIDRHKGLKTHSEVPNIVCYRTSRGLRTLETP